MDWSLLFDHRCQIPCNCSQTPTTSKIFEMVERLLQPVPMFLNAIFPMFDFRFPKTLWFLGISSMVLALATFLTQRFMAFIATWNSYLHTATSALSTNFWHRFFACDSIARSPSSLREQRALPSYLAAFCTCYRLHCVTHITSTTITLLKFWAICIAVTLIAIQSLGIKNNRHASLNDKTRRRKVLWSIFNPRLGNRFVQCGMRGQPYFISILSLTNFWNSNSTKKLWILCHSGRDGSTTCQSINRRPAVQWQLLTFCVEPIAQPKAW